MRRRTFADLRNFAYAAAKHFSGSELDENGVKIPAVRLWTAWNEPNQLFQLYPQYKRIHGKYVMVSAINYAKICTAVYAGVHATLSRARRSRAASPRRAATTMRAASAARRRRSRS